MVSAAARFLGLIPARGGARHIVDGCTPIRKLGQRGVAHPRTLQKIHEGVFALDLLAEHTRGNVGRQGLGTDPSGPEPLLLAADRVALAGERAPTDLGYHAETATRLGPSQAPMVLPQP